MGRQAWLPSENKGCMYSADTHHQSHTACGQNDYLLYVNPLSNKAGYPLMGPCCYYCRQNITSKCHRPTASDWLCPIETRWWNWKVVISGGEVTWIFRQGKWWLCCCCWFVLSSFVAKVWYCQVNNGSSLRKQHISANYLIWISTRLQ